MYFLERMNFLKIFSYLVITLCSLLFAWEMIIIMTKAIKKESFQAANEIKFEQLFPPVITLCPGEAWKSSGPFKNDEHFDRSTFKAEEIFHPKTLEMLRQNENRFLFKEQYATYYGLCFVIQKLTSEKISDYSTVIAVNNTMNYYFYMHEPFENEWLYMSVYPYEVNIYEMNANNDKGIGGASIKNSKEIVKKIPGTDGCEEKTTQELIECWKDQLALSLAKASIKCKVPALRFSRFDTSHLNDCRTKEQALEVEGLIYTVAQENLDKDVCGKICQSIKYNHNLATYGKKVLSKELQDYGDGYFIIWSYYSSLYVKEKVETYLFDLDAVIVAVGGNLGLFMGYSLKSIIISIAEVINALWRKYYGRNEVEEIKKQGISNFYPSKFSKNVAVASFLQNDVLDKVENG